MEKNLRSWMIEKNHTYQDLAGLSGLSIATIVNITSGKHSPSLSTIRYVSEALQVKPELITEFKLAKEAKLASVTL